MYEPIRRRLANERLLLERALPRLRDFVTLGRTCGEPTTTYRFALQPFGFVVRQGGASEPAPFDPARHGPIELVLGADPDLYPARPWQAQVLAAADVLVFSPHVGEDRGVRGAVCWLDQSVPFDPSAWPVHTVLEQVLRILSGECFAIEGFALQEDAKVWYLQHVRDLPFARVPVEPAPSPGQRAAGTGEDTLESALGIEFSPGGAA